MRPQGRPIRATPCTRLSIRADAADAQRWSRLLRQGTIALTGAELLRLLLDTAERRGAIPRAMIDLGSAQARVVVSTHNVAAQRKDT